MSSRDLDYLLSFTIPW